MTNNEVQEIGDSINDIQQQTFNFLNGIQPLVDEVREEIIRRNLAMREEENEIEIDHGSDEEDDDLEPERAPPLPPPLLPNNYFPVIRSPPYEMWHEVRRQQRQNFFVTLEVSYVGEHSPELGIDMYLFMLTSPQIQNLELPFPNPSAYDVLDFLWNAINTSIQRVWGLYYRPGDRGSYVMSITQNFVKYSATTIRWWLEPNQLLDFDTLFGN